MENEDVVVFLEDGRTRSLRGVIIREDADFIHLKRRDGAYQLAKRFIVKVERRVPCTHSFKHFNQATGGWQCSSCGAVVEGFD
jgi:hypothetical protein